MRHSLQEGEISTVSMPCPVASQPGHYAKNRKATHLGLRAYSAGDHGEDGSLSVCQESKSAGLSANLPSDIDSGTQGEGKGEGESLPNHTATQPKPMKHSNPGN